MGAEFDDVDFQYHEFVQLATAIGFVVIHWSQIERQIDNWVMVVFNHCGGEKLGKKPIKFTDKRKYLIRCLQNLPLLAPFKEEGIRLLDDAFNISLKRNSFIHGTLNDTEAINGVFQFQRLVHSEKSHQVENFSYALAEWPALEQSISTLLRESGLLSAKLAEAFFNDRMEDF